MQKEEIIINLLKDKKAFDITIVDLNSNILVDKFIINIIDEEK